MDDTPNPVFRHIGSLHEVQPAQWNALLERTAPGYPFLRHEFLSALEDSGAVGVNTGWSPSHVLAEQGGHLVAAAPVYRKQHSFGEFVFDFAWADANHRIGQHYYPKLVCCIPFNPVIGPRLLASSADTRCALAAYLSTLPEIEELSSFHLLFAWAQDREALPQTQALFRRGCEFQWHNRDYSCFDDFLAQLSAKRRKEIRRERRRIRAAGIQVRVLAPAEIDATLWDTLYAFYARTYLVRGQQPYLGRQFFQILAQSMPESMRFFVAYGPDGPLGMAFMLLGGDTLYGRHWGCANEINGLHFETCYYAGIDYCITHRLARFDAGAQGEHKLRRGFEPVATYSAHVIREPRLGAAIADFCRREGDILATMHADYRAHCGFPAASGFKL